MRHIAYTLLLLVAAALTATAATPDQMEQARVQAIKYCLRNMNDGSDYLDKTSPKSLSDLEKALTNTKDKNNFAKLKAISLPAQSEYGAWDKSSFDQYWTKKFVSQAGVSTHAYCGTQIGKAISGINSTAEAAKPAEEKPAEEKPAETEQEKPAESADDAAATQVEAEADIPAVETAPVATNTPNLDDEVPVVETEVVSPAPEQQPKKQDSNTASIIVLCILVVVVVALVGYALNVMKKNKARQSSPSRRVREEEYEEPQYSQPTRSNKGRRSYEPERYDRGVATVSSDPEDESPFAAYSAYQPEPEPAPRDSRDSEIERLRAEVSRLQKKLHTEEAASATSFTPAPRRTPRIIYLAQANSDGVFTRADAKYNMGNSIFKLVTTDGVSGSFSVIEDPTVFELALMMPTDFLVNACIGRDLQQSRGASTIVNEASGTAIFEDGRWRVSRKAQIRYAR